MDQQQEPQQQQQQQQDEIPQPRAPYPAPPPFWKHFTKANIARLHELESSSSSSGGGGGGVPEKLPLELTYLRPPPPPPPAPATSTETTSTAAAAQPTHYTIFNQIQPLNTSAPALPPAELLLFNPDKQPVDHAVLLTRLTKSMLLNFLELVTVLAHDPLGGGVDGGGGGGGSGSGGPPPPPPPPPTTTTTSAQDKIEDIRQLVLNAHVVINMYRPVQAREAVREMLEARLEDGRREIEEMERKKVAVREYLDRVRGWRERVGVQGQGQGQDQDQDQLLQLQEDGGGEVRKDAATSNDKAEIERARKLWEIVHEIASE